MKKVAMAFLLVIVFCSWAAAESSVWKAQKGKTVLYLGGTCHVLRESDYPLPAEYQKAYRASDMVVFETDIGKLQDPAAQQKLLAGAMYTDGSTIKDHLSAKTYAELKAYCDANNIPLEKLSRLKPSMLMVTLTLTELMKMGVTQHGVDTFFYDLALKDKKPVGQLETVDQQIGFLTTMSEGNEDQFVSYSLKDMNQLKEKFDAMADAWRKGETGKLDRLMLDDLKGIQPKLYKTLIADRNRNWLKRIDGYEKSPRIRFILVGVGHLVGPDGIIESLRKRGYRIEQIQAQ